VHHLILSRGFVKR